MESKCTAHPTYIMQMEAEIAQQNKIQSSIRQETYLLKKSANELKDQIANLSIALRELQAEERQLSKEVVHSPDRIKVELAEATKKLEVVKRSIQEKQNERDMTQKQVEYTNAAEECVTEVLTVMDKMETIVQEYEIVVEDCDDAQNRLEGVEANLEERMREKTAQEEQLQEVEKQTSSIITVLTQTLTNAQNKFDTAVNRLGVVESERLDGIARIEASEKRVEELRVNIDGEMKKAHEDIGKRIASFHKFEKEYYSKEENLNPQLGYLG